MPDFHIYFERVVIPDSFLVISKLAEHPRIKQVQYVNLLDTEEKCLEWHAWYEDDCGELWQLDMIHIIKGSTYRLFRASCPAHLADADRRNLAGDSPPEIRTPRNRKDHRYPLLSGGARRGSSHIRRIYPVDGEQSDRQGH